MRREARPLEELKAKVDTLTQSNVDLRDAVDELKELLVVNHERVDAVEAKATKTRTWMALGLLGVLALALLLFGANRITVSQARADTARYIRTVITTCTVGAARLPESQVAYCERAIPGFRKARTATAARAAVIDSLERWAMSGSDEPWVPPTTTTTYPDPPQ